MPDHQTETQIHVAAEFVEVSQKAGPAQDGRGDRREAEQKRRLGWKLPAVALAVIIIGIAWYFRAIQTRYTVTVMLDAVTSEPDEQLHSFLTVRGIATHLGEPVGGQTQITVANQVDGSYLASRVVLHGEQGFEVQFKESADWLKQRYPLVITADYSGTAYKLAVKGTATRYLNTTGPPSTWLLWSPLPLLGALIYLFALPLTTAKARFLFGLTYGITFIACALPLLAVKYASENPFLRSKAESSSVGLLEATTESEKEPQWWVVLGGEVVQQEQNGTSYVPPVLKGGVTVPLFVLLLAVLGAGINLTREVPRIQLDSDFMASGKNLDSSKSAQIKRDLIEAYMYFLSAPVLVVAIYYLLQAVMTTVGKPTLVLAAFATGLMTNAATEAIIAFADRIFRNLRETREEQEQKEAVWKRRNAEDAAKKAGADAPADPLVSPAGTSHLAARG